MNNIDWTPLLKYPPNECECRCGAVYKSLTKGVRTADGGYKTVSKEPCPACGKQDDMRRVSFPPERTTLS